MSHINLIKKHRTLFHLRYFTLFICLKKWCIWHSLRIYFHHVIRKTLHKILNNTFSCGTIPFLQQICKNSREIIQPLNLKRHALRLSSFLQHAGAKYALVVIFIHCLPYSWSVAPYWIHTNHSWPDKKPPCYKNHCKCSIKSSLQCIYSYFILFPKVNLLHVHRFYSSRQSRMKSTFCKQDSCRLGCK